MTRFEYAVETVDTRKKKRMPDILMKRGEEGWDLVSVVKDGPVELCMFFKRPLSTSAPVAA